MGPTRNDFKLCVTAEYDSVTPKCPGTAEGHFDCGFNVTAHVSGAVSQETIVKRK